MSRPGRILLAGVGVVVVVVVIAALALPLFLNADSFRTRIESTMSKSLGRRVSISNLNLAVWSGGMVAKGVAVADDPRFSTQPFIKADSVTIHVALFPLIFHREVEVKGFVLEQPQVQLLRAPDGTWNYSSIGNTNKRTEDAETKQAFPSLTVGEVLVNNGRISVGSVGDATAVAALPTRVYQQVNLNVKNFGFMNAFPFTVAAHLPGDGTVNVSGTAGPINQQDASLTPFSGHLVVKHVDPLAAGFVTPAEGISGLVESLELDAAWSGQQMHVTKLLVDSPHLTLVRSSAPKPPKAAATNAEGSTMLQNLSVDSAEIRNGTLTLTTAGQTGAPAVYQQVNATVTNLTPKTASPFTASAQLPGGGTLNAKGTAGPFNQTNNASTPVDAQVMLKHVDLGTAGVLPPDAGIAGVLDLNAQVQSNGETLNAAGTAQVAGIKLARDGQPSAKPLNAQFQLSQNERAMTGTLQRATVSVGGATLNLSGTYQTSGPTTALNLRVAGQSVPIDSLEAFLPALGVKLPSGSRLQGGTVTTNLTVSGSTASPVISGPVRLDNTVLAGFDLGAKLSTLSQLTGGRIGSATGSGTRIRSLSMDVRESEGNIRTDKVALSVAGVGTATGSGGVSRGGALDYSMLLKLTELTGGGASSAATAPSSGSTGGGLAGLAGGLAGLIGGGGGGSVLSGLTGSVLRSGIPVQIGGTTSNPTFAPNLRGLTSSLGASAARQALSGQRTKGTQTNKDSLTNALGGLLGRH